MLALLRQYLQLARLPNVFTAPPDVIAGYLAATYVVASASGSSVSSHGMLDLVALMVSSALLYVAGIIFNDIFDIEIDRKERPFRPLPSGAISKQKAWILAISSAIAANAIAAVVGPESLAVSMTLIAVIIAYDYRLKHNAIAGPAAMGGARFLNIFLGASPSVFLFDGIFAPSTSIEYGDGIKAAEVVLLASISIFIYVAMITWLSRREAGDSLHYGMQRRLTFTMMMAPPFAVVFSLIAAIAVIGMFFLKLDPAFLISLAIFATMMVLTLKRAVLPLLSSRNQQPANLAIQSTIRNMVISIILLDSVFVSATAGLAPGLAILGFIIPPVILSKKLYVT